VNRLTARVVILRIGSKRSDLASSFKDAQRNSLDVRLWHIAFGHKADMPDPLIDVR
jgi:hypothetical protein